MSRDLNREILELLGFEGEELDAFMPDWLIARERCLLNDEKLAYAIDTYIPQNWDIKYRGVRKMLGAWVRELAAVVQTPELKAKGVKIVYGILPAIVTYYYAAKKAGGDNIYVAFPDLLMVTILNGIFDAADPFLYEAEKNGFSYGCRHCPLNKMRFGAYITGTIAAPDLIWSWGFNCDEGPKTDELIQRLTGKEWNYHVSRVPHDSTFSEKEDLMDYRVRYMSEQMKLGVKAIEEATGIKVEDEHMAQANAEFGRISFKIGMLNQMICSANPPILGGEAISFFLACMSVPVNGGFKYIEEALDILTKELRKAVKNGEGVMPKDTPKVGFYNLPFCIPWMGKLFRDNGVIPTFNSGLSRSKYQNSPSRFPDDPWMAAAESWSRDGMCQNLYGEAMTMIEKVQEANVDGMILGLFDFDRWLGVHQKLVAKIVADESDTPTYYLEGDFWDDREYNQEALKTKIESLCQIITTRKAMKLMEEQSE